VPGRPEVSNIDELGQYDAVLLLANGGGTTWWGLGVFFPLLPERESST
jgi:hypothetical protein